MNPTLIATAAALAISVLTLSQTGPSIVQAIASTSVDAAISREEALVTQLQQYRALRGEYPTTMDELIQAGFWRADDNSNGYGGQYAFSVDAQKGVITITTNIADDQQRAQYVGSYKHSFRPVDQGGGVVSTAFALPTTGPLGTPVARGEITASATAPDAASNRFWYDTSGATATLKVSSGADWSKTSAGATAIGAPSAANIVKTPSALPSTASDGDVRYLYSDDSNRLDTYIYFGGKWALSAGGTNVPRVKFEINIDSTRSNYVLRSTSLQGYIPGKSDVTLTIAPGVTVGSNSTAAAALTIDASWNAGDALHLINKGSIIGMGGAGGRANEQGYRGGAALIVQFPASLTNEGRIAGGGGGGGGSYTAGANLSSAGGAGGGGGQGFGASLGGRRDDNFSGVQFPQAQNGMNGSLSAPGEGGQGVKSGAYPNQYSAPWTSESGRGGHGGGLGQSGGDSVAGVGAYGNLPIVGGWPGWAVYGHTVITWKAFGEILGPIQ